MTVIIRLDDQHTGSMQNDHPIQEFPMMVARVTEKDGETVISGWVFTLDKIKPIADVRFGHGTREWHWSKHDE